MKESPDTMKIQCAWCQKDLTVVTEQNADEKYPVSHGICSKCAELLLKDLEMPIKTFINQFKMPVMVVDDVNNVIVANEATEEISAMKFDIGDQLKCGNLIGCVHSDQPEGCGATVHCQACVIRKAILFTHETGQPFVEQACPDHHFFKGNRNPTMIVSSEKFGNRILLKVENLNKAGK
ncbi:MAG: hypothetical protein PWR01_2822 [Clostridiales bacterium]|nr:hypothetical protein [Clostridiales bacterium]MDN5281749.1 hypothetical protein [Candidatus Ozemobacter sp.]